MTTTKTQEDNKSFFDCCACGDNEKNKEVLVDITSKKPDLSVPTSFINTTSSLTVQRPPSVLIERTTVKPARVTFTYTSPSLTNASHLSYSVNNSILQKESEKKTQNTS